MVIVSSKEFKDKQNKYLELAKEDKVLVKRGKKYINLFVTDEPDNNLLDETWVKEFFSIPEEFRCNPFDNSPSGDLFWADKRNVEYVEKQTEISMQQYKEGNYTTCRTLDELNSFLDSL